MPARRRGDALPTQDEFTVEAFARALQELRDELVRVRRALHRGYRQPTRSIEHEYDEDLEEALDFDDREDDQ